MIHPLFKTTLKRPDLVARHLANYVDLVQCEASDIAKGLLVQGAAAIVAILSLLLALGLTGVSVMLGVLAGRFHWALVAVPAVAWLIALAGAIMARRSKLREDIKDVRDELELDLKVLALAKELNNE
ncbi:hypothetical protein [Variovorax saccharolyticus]|uniref:hypothetical protein n=1 Tax=Variovorax saccharolyticus TaxID=3053516 RepID=UPI002578C489|nr:hypothetical protein [Variovorax sp. J22R187]MDM0022419.1 hypothetical protein [Variovorax sp. J22R187]